MLLLAAFVLTASPHITSLFALMAVALNFTLTLSLGIQCAADVPLNDTHLAVAKEVLMSLLFFGITEHFKTSVCQLAWMYGGDPVPKHFTVSRR
jgi:hypothetical protein